MILEEMIDTKREAKHKSVKYVHLVIRFSAVYILAYVTLLTLVISRYSIEHNQFQRKGEL